MRATSPDDSARGSPFRQRIHTAAVSAAAVTGHASYRVRHASAKATPTSRGVGRCPQAHAISIATAAVVVASSSGSVIGVACRYRTFGFNTNTAAAAAAAAADSVTESTIQVIAAVATAYEAIDIATADAPLR